MVLARINGVNALLACAQQNNADAMVDFAELPGINKQALTDNAVSGTYHKHPRNAFKLDNGGVRFVASSCPRCFAKLRLGTLN